MDEDSLTAKRTSLPYNFLAGGLAGCVAKTVIAPLDRAKINFQSTEWRFTVRDLFRFLQQSFRDHGFFSLWRGNTATLFRIFPYAAIQYSVHERCKHVLGIDHPDMSHMCIHLDFHSVNFAPCTLDFHRPVTVFFYGPLTDLRLRRLLAGCTAGTTCVACTYPLDFSRARMAVTNYEKYNNPVHAIRTVIREEGIMALYRGFLPTILGVIPYSGIGFFTFETLKGRRLDGHFRHTGVRPQKLQPLENLCCGAIAGVLGQTASYPLDIVRRRMQNARVTGHPEYLKSIWRTLRIVYSTEGVFHGLYKGVTINWIKGPISSGISFTVFHQVQHFLHWYDNVYHTR
ncbi:unnamed protein product [Dicrocoelium dendriticum]|nr:unnamed protein product [Dicrocoelium dendriticum]